MRLKYDVSKTAHHKIFQTYMSGTGAGEVAALADELNLPKWKISRYAVDQGWQQKTKKEPVWSDRELEILERWAHIIPIRIQMKLKAAGFSRSLTGIVLKRKRMRFLANLRGQSANSLAQCFGVEIHFVLRIIREGKLKAKRRGTGRTEQQGGDMWFIKDRDIREYIIENVNEIDFRKVDKYWFTDIVYGRAVE